MCRKEQITIKQNKGVRKYKSVLTYKIIARFIE